MEIFEFKPKETRYSTPLLFVHGMWHAAWCWEGFITHFTKAGFTCYSFNLRKHGHQRNPKGIRWVKISDYVRDLENVVDQLGTTPVIIGHSMGGFILQKYLEKSEPAASIFLASIPHTGTFKATLRFMGKYPFAFLRMILTFNMIAMITSEDRYSRMFLTEGTDLSKNFEKVQNEAFRAYLDTFLFNLPKTKKIRKTITNFDNVLFLAAEKDAFFTPKSLQNTAKKYNAHFHLFKDLAHNMMTGPGSEKVAEFCIDFLSSRIE